MAVRRLHSEQPASFAFTEANTAWGRAAIAKYPKGKEASAVIPLLWRAQEQGGWLSEPAMRAVADMLGLSYIRVYEIATFYTMFQLAPVGSKAHVQVCGTTPCMLRGSGELIAVCKHRIAVAAHQLSKDGKFSWEEVECLGSCANAPMVQIGADTYEDLTADTLMSVLEGFAKGRPPKPGSQAGRQASSPAGNMTTLNFGSAGKSSAPGPAANISPPNTSAGPSHRPDRTSSGDGNVGSGIATSHVVVGDESVGEMLRPASLPAPRGGKGDDLKLIRGVGPGLEQVLNKLGLYHFDQIAGLSKSHIKWIDQQLEDYRGRAERDKWVEQAKKLATGWRPEKNVGEKPKV